MMAREVADKIIARRQWAARDLDTSLQKIDFLSKSPFTMELFNDYDNISK